VVEKTHLARLHYKCLNNFHAKSRDFCLSLLGILSSVCTFRPAQQARLSTVTQNHPGTIHNLITRPFSSHQLFTPFSISNASHIGIMGISKGFSLHRLCYIIVRELLARVKYDGM